MLHLAARNVHPLGVLHALPTSLNTVAALLLPFLSYYKVNVQRLKFQHSSTLY